jgi:hypothetical protein
MGGRLLFLSKPWFEEADGHLAHGAAIPRRFGFHFTVEVIRNLKGRLPKTRLLYCRVKNKGEAILRHPDLPGKRVNRFAAFKLEA